MVFLFQFCDIEIWKKIPQKIISLVQFILEKKKLKIKNQLLVQNMTRFVGQKKSLLGIT